MIRSTGMFAGAGIGAVLAVAAMSAAAHQSPDSVVVVAGDDYAPATYTGSASPFFSGPSRSQMRREEAVRQGREVTAQLNAGQPKSRQVLRAMERQAAAEAARSVGRVKHKMALQAHRGVAI